LLSAVGRVGRGEDGPDAPKKKAYKANLKLAEEGFSVQGEWLATHFSKRSLNLLEDGKSRGQERAGGQQGADLPARRWTRGDHG